MKKILTVSALALALGAATTVQAAGYQLSEYSTTNLGRSFAGAGMVGDDYSALGYNPAGMNYNEKSGFQFGASTVGIRSHAKGDVTYGDGTTLSGKTDPYIVRVLPEGFAQYKLNDRATAGIGIYVPFGLTTDYDNDWFGRTHALRSQVLALNVSPALAYKITDQISIGAALNIQYFEANLTGGIETSKYGAPMYLGGKSDLKGDDTRVGYTVGVTAEPIKGTRLGVAYRSEVDHKLHGKNKVTGLTGLAAGMNGTTNVNAKISTPEMVFISANQVITNKWSVSATARWTGWNNFKDLGIYNDEDGSLISNTKENWRNQWFYSVGTDYKYTENWTVRLGAAYDQPAVKSPANRTARIPDGRRIWTSLGLSYTKNNWQFDGGYAHLFVKSAKATHGPDNASKFNAKYNSNANIFSLNAQYSF